jgi:hypothetical protein
MTGPQQHDAELVALGHMSVPIKAEVFWERREPAVYYALANGDRETHRIGMEDLPILLQLERARKLRTPTSANDFNG